jgi:hypothetical protein
MASSLTNRKLSIILIFFLIGILSPLRVNVLTEQSSSNSEEITQIKIMTYNIDRGGESNAYLSVVKEENPDIFFLIETGTWETIII